MTRFTPQIYGYINQQSFKFTITTTLITHWNSIFYKNQTWCSKNHLLRYILIFAAISELQKNLL